MDPLSDIEYDILNSLYFVESFDKILEESKASEPIVADCLKILISRKWVSPMIFDQEKNDYVSSFIYDTDNMRDYHYVATRDGLIVHNGK